MKHSRPACTKPPYSRHSYTKHSYTKRDIKLELDVENKQKDVVCIDSCSARFWFSIATVFLCFLLIITFSNVVIADEHRYLQSEKSQTFYLLTHTSLNKKSALNSEDLIVEDIRYLKNDAKRFQSYREVEHVLFEHYLPGEDDPKYFKQELSNLAKYISRYPSSIQLIRALRKKAWGIRYKARSFETKITGSRMQIVSVDVYFDPRSAAQLKFHRACAKKRAHCIASPADAFLHELLHVKSVVLDPLKFLMKGGMETALYPYSYEMNIIDEENLLYRSMTKIDSQPRPIRREHYGKYTVARCVTCL